MKNIKVFSLYVIQISGRPEDVFVGQTWEVPESILEHYNSGGQFTPKKLRDQGELLLRKDLYNDCPTFSTLGEALLYESVLAERLQAQGFGILSRSLERTMGKRNKKYKMRVRLAMDPIKSDFGNYNRELSSKSNVGDIFSYGRKKSLEWNDEAADKFQQSLTEKIKQKLADSEGQ